MLLFAYLFNSLGTLDTKKVVVASEIVFWFREMILTSSAETAGKLLRSLLQLASNSKVNENIDPLEYVCESWNAKFVGHDQLSLSFEEAVDQGFIYGGVRGRITEEYTIVSTAHRYMLLINC